MAAIFFAFESILEKVGAIIQTVSIILERIPLPNKFTINTQSEMKQDRVLASLNERLSRAPANFCIAFDLQFSVTVVFRNLNANG